MRSALALNGAASQMPFERRQIPPILTELKRWVTWRARPDKLKGKIGKVPINATTAKLINANNPSNWLTFEAACAAYDAGKCSGIGIVLCDHPVTQIDGQAAYLVALDLDHCEGKANEVKALWKTLGRPYIEVSPSGSGIRMLALSKVLTRSGNAGDGREMYSTGRFVTITGTSGYGELVDATDQLQILESKWFKPKNQYPDATSARPGMLGHLLTRPQPQTPQAVARVKDQLSYVSADCSYEIWRNVVWALLSTGWSESEKLAHDWSMTAAHRFDQGAFEQLCRSFDCRRGIALGTLGHYAKENGWQPVAALPTLALTQTVEGTAQRSRLLTRDDLQALPPLRWLIRDVLPRCGLAALYGPSGSGKTFLAMDLACSLATALPSWFGAVVKPAPMAYVALEGEAGIRSRLAAWETHHGQQVSTRMRFLLGNFTLLKAEDSEQLAAEIRVTLGTGAVVVIDTLNQSAPGADENASTDMGRVIANAKALADAIEGLVILVHHAGKDVSRGMRGHSSLYAAMDTVIEVSSGATGRAWRLAKSKEGESGAEHRFELVPYVVGQDEDSQDIRSCAVRPVLGQMQGASKPASGKHQKAALEVLRALALDHPKGVALQTAINAVGLSLDCPDERRHNRATEAIKGLTESGHLQMQDDGGLVLL